MGQAIAASSEMVCFLVVFKDMALLLSGCFAVLFLLCSIVGVGQLIPIPRQEVLEDTLRQTCLAVKWG